MCLTIEYEGIYSCDFESTVYDGQKFTEVWAAASVQLGTEDVRIDGSIGDMFNYFYSMKKNLILYFHNLAFDGSFILNYFLKNGWAQAYNEDSGFFKDKNMPAKSLKYIISAQGRWYNIVLKYNNNNTITIKDSLKLIPFSVKDIGKSFCTKRHKLDMEYKGLRYANCTIKEEEKETEVMKSQTIEKEQPKKKAEKKPSKKVDEKSNRQPKKSPKVKDEVPVKEPRKNKTPENIDQIVKDTEKYLDEVLRAMGLDPKLNLYYNRRDNVLNINVSGEKMGALIGKHGQTLDALQYLISLYVNKESDSFVKIKLDTENYRERRQQTLEKLAGSIAYKVKKNKKPIYLEPMNPNERRIIHSALQRDPEVITKSEGKDPYRKVVVMLKK